MQALDVLDGNDSSIASLKGLQHATNLRDLSLQGNTITDVTPLQSLINLRNLQLQENRITIVTPLAENTGLDAGDDVFVNLNCLDLAPGSVAMVDITTLTSRGVNVVYEPQSVCMP